MRLFNKNHKLNNPGRASSSKVNNHLNHILKNNPESIDRIFYQTFGDIPSRGEISLSDKNTILKETYRSLEPLEKKLFELRTRIFSDEDPSDKKLAGEIEYEVRDLKKRINLMKSGISKIEQANFIKNQVIGSLKNDLSSLSRSRRFPATLEAINRLEEEIEDNYDEAKFKEDIGKSEFYAGYTGATARESSLKTDKYKGYRRLPPKIKTQQDLEEERRRKLSVAEIDQSKYLKNIEAGEKYSIGDTNYYLIKISKLDLPTDLQDTQFINAFYIYNKIDNNLVFRYITKTKSENNRWRDKIRSEVAKLIKLDDLVDIYDAGTATKGDDRYHVNVYDENGEVLISKKFSKNLYAKRFRDKILDKIYINKLNFILLDNTGARYPLYTSDPKEKYIKKYTDRGLSREYEASGRDSFKEIYSTKIGRTIRKSLRKDIKKIAIKKRNKIGEFQIAKGNDQDGKPIFYARLIKDANGNKYDLMFSTGNTEKSAMKRAAILAGFTAGLSDFNDNPSKRKNYLLNSSYIIRKNPDLPLSTPTGEQSSSSRTSRGSSFFDSVSSGASDLRTALSREPKFPDVPIEVVLSGLRNLRTAFRRILLEGKEVEQNSFILGYYVGLLRGSTYSGIHKFISRRKLKQSVMDELGANAAILEKNIIFPGSKFSRKAKEEEFRSATSSSFDSDDSGIDVGSEDLF